MRMALLQFAGVALLTLAVPLRSAALQGSYEAAVTRIPVKLTERLSSQDARTGDAFVFDTTSSVATDGMFLAAGTHGHGVVVAARSARGPRPGQLRLEARSLELPGGGSLAVGLEPGQLDRTLTGDVRGFTVPIAGAPVLVGGNRSTNVVYEKGTPFVVVAPPPATPPPDSAPAPLSTKGEAQSSAG